MKTKILFTILLIIPPSLAFSKVTIIEQSIQGHSVNEWCEAIRKTNGDDNYGISTEYRHTVKLEACRNTVLSRYKDWSVGSQRESFAHILQRHYCPIGAPSDDGTCKNWEGNLVYYLGME